MPSRVGGTTDNGRIELAYVDDLDLGSDLADMPAELCSAIPLLATPLG